MEGGGGWGRGTTTAGGSATVWDRHVRALDDQACQIKSH